jgi:uncharacterized membrane protein YjgN (DUF898 family)
MNAVKAASVPEAGSVHPNEGRGRFLGDKREYWRILAREALSLIITIGLYRFWVSTDVRRYLWSHSELADEQLDYTGDPFELLVGFLVLLVVLAPLVAIFSILSLMAGSLSLAIVAAYAPVVVLFPLGVVALYQARRYRVNHTVFRGLRFHQTGSAWVYALRAAVWFVVNVVTFGLSYPWARASLERYKMRHTFFGDLQGGFEESGWGLFKRGAPLWLLVVLGLMTALALDGDAEQPVWTPAALLVVGLVIYPIFHATVLRWRVAGIRFGALAFASAFSTWALCKAYLKFYGLLVLLAIIAGVVVVVVELMIVPALPVGGSIVFEFIGVLCLVIAYFAAATAAAFAYQGTVRFETWRLIVDALVIRGLDQLDRVKVHAGHAARHAGRIGAALNLGGF